MNEFMKENEVIGEVRAPLEHASPAEENKPDTAEKKPENRISSFFTETVLSYVITLQRI